MQSALRGVVVFNFKKLFQSFEIVEIMDGLPQMTFTSQENSLKKKGKQNKNNNNNNNNNNSDNKT